LFFKKKEKEKKKKVEAKVSRIKEKLQNKTFCLLARVLEQK
jgi:hypothetical protein